YRQIAGSSTDPRAYATAVAQAYAVAIASNQLPYTISVFDMARFDSLNTAISILGAQLRDYVQVDPVVRIPQLKSLPAGIQKYDSGGAKLFEIDNEDTYIDLLDLTEKLQETISDPAVGNAAGAVRTATLGARPFLIYERHASGEFIAYDSQL